MSETKYVSEIKTVYHNQEVIFNYLSNFENLSKYVNEGLLAKMTEQVPQIQISNFESDADSCRFQISGMGLAEIRIVEREPHKTIKVSSSGSLPVQHCFLDSATACGCLRNQTPPDFGCRHEYDDQNACQ